jgi:uncharacterized membrane protein
MMDMMNSMGIWALLVLLILLAGIAAAVYVGVRAAKGPARSEGDAPRDALRRRLAAGEISLDEFHERDAALRDRF